MPKIFGSAAEFAEQTKLAVDLVRGNSTDIDQRFMAMAEETTKGSPLFRPIGQTALEGVRPDSVRHERTLLLPNPYSTKEKQEKLLYVDLLLGSSAESLQTTFSAYFEEHRIFERLMAGQKFVIPSNHLELADQGFTAGLVHKAGEEKGIDRLENHLVMVIGRLLGYYYLGKEGEGAENVIDDILRKVSSVLKTFPAGGSEALPEDGDALSIVRSICNSWTKHEHSQLLGSGDGFFILEALSGAQDRHNATRGVVEMREFHKGTCTMLIEACEKGAELLPLFADYDLTIDAPTRHSMAHFLPPRTVGTIEECHQLGEDLAAAGSHTRGQASLEHPEIERFKIPIAYGWSV